MKLLAVVFFSILFYLQLQISFSQVVVNRKFIERQLLCALEEAPCDGFGQQIKGTLFNKISLIKLFFS